MFIGANYILLFYNFFEIIFYLHKNVFKKDYIKTFPSFQKELFLNFYAGSNFLVCKENFKNILFI